MLFVIPRSLRKILIIRKMKASRDFYASLINQIVIVDKWRIDKRSVNFPKDKKKN